MSEISFTKIQSTGNDFVVVDYDSVPNTLFDRENIQKVCHRNYGVGADGLIALEKSDAYSFRFHYYNADGSRGSMCGNGLRAAIRFASDNHWIHEKQSFQFMADDGMHQGEINNNNIKANIIVKESAREISLADFSLPNWITKGYTVNTGVPHLVLVCNENLKNKEIIEIGRKLRYHEKFQPAGSNINFVEILDESRIYIRTYERGVENETLSCGTGVTAASLVVKAQLNLVDKIGIVTNGGNLKISFENEMIFINGPSECSFNGKIEI